MKSLSREQLEEELFAFISENQNLKKQIFELQRNLAEANQQIEKLKNCRNCGDYLTVYCEGCIDNEHWIPLEQ